MSIRDLLRAPQASISARLAAAPHQWLLPLTGYTFLSLAEGHHRMVARLPASPPVVVFVAALAFAAMVGSWLWAAAYGGALHASARVLGGKAGVGGSVQAVGYALVWPGFLAATSAIALSFSPGPLAYVFMALNLAAAGWAIYTVVAAIRIRHAFTWWRATSTWLLTLLAVVIVALTVVRLFHRAGPA